MYVPFVIPVPDKNWPTPRKPDCTDDTVIVVPDQKAVTTAVLVTVMSIA